MSATAALKFDRWAGVSDIEEKALSEHADYWQLQGYAATYAKDKIKDVIIPGAFRKSLDRVAQSGDSIQLYFNHKTDDAPLGVCTELVEDRKGLRYAAQLPKDDEFVAKRIVPQIKRRSLKSNSFGFRIKDFERRKDDGGRNLKELDLIEISVVGFPCGNGADIDSIKGLVPFQDLAIDRAAKSWDASAALSRIKAAFGDSDDDIRRAFLYADESKAVDELDPRLLIADFDDAEKSLVVNHVALYKVSASLCGARGGLKLPADAEDAVKSHLDRYYQRLDIGSPFQSLSDGEFWSLDLGEREARLKSLGISRKLATKLSGLRDADRKSEQRDAVPPEDAAALLTAALMRAADAIQSTRRT